MWDFNARPSATVKGAYLLRRPLSGEVRHDLNAGGRDRYKLSRFSSKEAEDHLNLSLEKLFKRGGARPT